jgi:hypothetical protein
LLFFVVSFLACAHGQRDDRGTALKKAAHQYLISVRWSDWMSASQLIVPEKRDAFMHARRKGHDERDLSISDFEIEEVKMAPDTLSGEVTAELNYTRLPSVTVKTEDTTLFLIWRDGRWLVDHEVGGPFPDLE